MLLYKFKILPNDKEAKLNILKLTQNIRSWLSQSGAIEILAYPRSLPYAWNHPDFIISALGKAKENIFSFQMMTPVCKSPYAKRSYPTPCVLWLIKPYNIKTQNKVSNFLKSTVNSILPTPEKISFSLKTTGCLKNSFGERGHSWKLLINGVECGSYVVITELLGKALNEPVCFCTVGIEAFIQYCSDEIPYEEWYKGKKVYSYVSTHAYAKHAETTTPKPGLIDKLLSNYQLSDYEKIVQLSEIISNNSLTTPKADIKKMQKFFLNCIENIKKIQTIEYNNDTK